MFPITHKVYEFPLEYRRKRLIIMILMCNKAVNSIIYKHKGCWKKITLNL